MKNWYSYSLIVLFSLSTLSFVQEENHSACDVTHIRVKSKDALHPDYQYDASKTTYILFSTKKQFKELEIPLFIGEKYRFVFNTESLPQNVDIEVYDKKYESKSREMLFSSKDEQAVDKQYIFEPQKAMRKVFVDYHIHATEAEEAKGCLVLTVGYRIKK